MTRTTARSRARRHRPHHQRKRDSTHPPLKRHVYREFEEQIDRRIGMRIRAALEALGVTQIDLAGQLGISYQQVQKYERAIDRVSASRLRMIADELDVPVGYFLDDPGPVPGCSCVPS